MEHVSRRSFIEGAGLGAVALGAAMGITGQQLAVADEAVDDAADADIAWDYEADVVIIGAGGAGLPAGLKAIEDGASVIMVEANWDCGGHTAISEGNLHSGGGTDLQKEFGIEDSADQYYLDHTWGGLVVSRMNDREYVRSVADSMLEAYNFIQEKGVVVAEIEPVFSGTSYFDPTKENGSTCDSVPRQTIPDRSAGDWVPYRGMFEGGIFISRPLEQSLRAEGGRFLMNYHMNKIYREPNNGRVTGIRAVYTPHIMPGDTESLDHLMHDGDIETTQETVNVKANKGVIVCTGGSTGNLEFRTGFDPRLGPEYDGLAGMPFSDQDGSGELAAMEIGAGLGTMANYSQCTNHLVNAVARVGCRYGYGIGYAPESKVWPLVVANGVNVDYDNMVMVNMLGERVGNNDLPALGKYIDESSKWFDNALGSVILNDEGDFNAVRYGGPIWAIFDQATCDQHEWDLTQGIVDYDNGYCFKADSLEELAELVVNKYYEDIKMDPNTLVETITNWNSYVDAGEDPEWGTVEHLVGKVQTPPFYAAWATPNLHDCYSGLRVNGKMQVLDIYGEPIIGLYCAGESSAGQRAHGHGRVITSGYIAGRSAAHEETGNPAPGSVSAGNAITTAMAVYGPNAGTAVADDNASDGDVEIFTGIGDEGEEGEVKLQISVANRMITNIEVIDQKETEGVGADALVVLVDEALQAQSYEIEGVSGATITSASFKEALATAMENAGLA